MKKLIETIVADSGLPVVDVIDGLRQQLLCSDEVVLQAPPGAGKTTLVPLALLTQPWLAGNKIIMLEPRRLAARAAAQRMASMLGEKAGETVGYRMRLDTRVSADTRVEVITEGILTRMLQRDPALNGVGLLVFDEFHERNLDSDLGLALALQGRDIYGDGARRLKLLVMSATLDGFAISKMLGNAPILQSSGRMYPVAVHYRDTPIRAEALVPELAATLVQLLQNDASSILVFLPGRAEIVAVARLVGAKLAPGPGKPASNVDIAPLYGGLSLEQQQLAIEPSAAGRRKVVLATNIAETSLTIDGIGIVVDSGLAREPVFDPATGMTRLQTRPISQASSEQRMGRAGRLGPGACYRMWSKPRQNQLAPHTAAEILQADLAPLALQLLAWGVDQPDQLNWLDPPPSAPFNQALQLLASVGAWETSRAGVRRLTDHGKRMAAMPLHPRLAHMLLVAADYQLQPMACQVAALLSERDQSGARGADLWQRWSLLAGHTAKKSALGIWQQRIQRQARQYQSLCPDAIQPSTINDHAALGLLLASAYPDRIARRRGGTPGVYQLSNGRGATLQQDDLLVNAEWLAVAELGGRVGDTQDQIYLAAELDPELFAGPLASQVTRHEQLSWDVDSDRMVARRQRKLGALVLDSEPLEDIDPQARQRIWCDILQQRGLDILPWNKPLRQWQARVLLLREHAIGGHWPDVSDAALLASLQQWLLPALGNINSLAQLRKLGLAALLHNMLPWPLPRQLDELAPLRLRVPSGSNIEIDYCQTVPVLAVKLQELFGCDSTPSIANGRVALLLHLLSPAGRPLQVTQDLAGFWRGSYAQVKKDMKGRYPKHPWPDDPLAAAPTRHAKRRSR